MLYEAMDRGLRVKPFKGAEWRPAQHNPSMNFIWNILEYLPIKRLAYDSNEELDSHSYPKHCTRRRVGNIRSSRGDSDYILQRSRDKALVRRRACDKIMHGCIPQAGRAMSCGLDCVVVINESYPHPSSASQSGTKCARRALV